MMLSLAFAAGALLGAAGAHLAARRREAARARRQLAAGADVGFDGGFDAALVLAGLHMRRCFDADLHGFARRCTECETLNACFQKPAREYWNCRRCGARHPSPLAPDSLDYAKP